mgnify:CR=1 FL=1
MPNFISEDQIEQAILHKLHEQYDFELLNCCTANADDLNDGSNRKDKHDVILEGSVTRFLQTFLPAPLSHILQRHHQRCRSQ